MLAATLERYMWQLNATGFVSVKNVTEAETVRREAEQQGLSVVLREPLPDSNDTYMVMMGKDHG